MQNTTHQGHRVGTSNVLTLTRENAANTLKKLPVMLRTGVRMLLGLERGMLTIELPEGRVLRIQGPVQGPHAHLKLNNFNLAKNVFQSGDVGVAETFMAGDWESEDVTTLLYLFCINRHLLAGQKRSFFTNLALTARHWFNRNTKSQAKKNIAAHYDLGNEFYKLWLDETMTYSSALYQTGAEKLSDAQNAKYAALADSTGISENDKVLEIGCGWGGFAEYAASHIGCNVKCLTISREQFEFAKQRIFDAGLNEKVEIAFQDYRDETEKFDRIASIEMFEAVGEEYWPTYFEKLGECLKPGGAAGLQIITVQDQFFDSYRKSTDFIQRYIFPGGMLPPPGKLVALGKENGLTLSGERIFGHDYADTLAEWRRRFEAAWPQIQPMGFDETFKRMWAFYFHYCEAGFRSENIDVRQMVFAKA